MKMKITFKPLRNPAARPVRINSKKVVMATARPAVNIGRAVWRGLRFHLRPREDFREVLHRLATAPFHIKLPGFKAGKA